MLVFPLNEMTNPNSEMFQCLSARQYTPLDYLTITRGQQSNLITSALAIRSVWPSVIQSVSKITQKRSAVFTETWTYQSEELINFWW